MSMNQGRSYGNQNAGHNSGFGQNRGMSGFKGNGKNKRGGFSGEATLRTPKASYKPSPTLPAPAYLSKMSSPEMNDPLAKDAFVAEPGTELRPKPDGLEFTPTCIGFMALIDQTYVALNAADANFGRRVSESAFTYYCAVGLWARLLSIEQLNNGALSFDERHFIEQMERMNLQYPNVIATYINSFGNFKGTDAGQYEMKLFTRPPTIVADGINGWWAVDAVSHTYYENFLHPSVAACRVLRDMANQAGAWDLPAAIGPAPWGQFNPGLPTENLLGWKPAVVLREEALQLLEGGRLSVNPQQFPSENGAVCMNTTLLTRIMQFVQSTSVFGLAGMSFTVGGSAGQGTWVEPARGEAYIAGTGRIQRNELLIQKSPWSLDGRVSNAAATMLLRFNRRLAVRPQAQVVAAAAALAANPPANIVIGQITHNNWSCYTWDDYAHVPDAWIATANAPYIASPPQLQAWLFWNAQYLQVPRVKHAR